MRGCLLLLLLVLLIAANGYAIWQIRLIRADLDRLIEEGTAGQESGLTSMLECARDAAEAIGRGETERAEAELERLRTMLRDARQMTRDQRQRLIDQLEAAKRAISRSAERAQEEINELIQMLSRRSDSEDD
jgi:predicted component of type VI protein secretion system